MAGKWWCYTHQIEGDYLTHDFTKYEEFSTIFVKHRMLTDMGGYAVEVGGLTKNIHIQGFLRLKGDKQCLSWLKKNVCKECHWSKMKGKPTDNIKYVEKDALAGPWFYPSKKDLQSHTKGARTDLHDAFALYETSGMQAVIDSMPEIVVKYPNFESVAKKRGIKYIPFNGPLRSWQAWFLKQVKQYDNDRVIHWLYDSQGGIGKSKLSHFLRDKFYVQLSGPVANMAYMFDPKCNGVLFDITRTQADAMDHIYQFAEQVKNGYIVSGKYHSCALKFVPKTVIIFANFAPDPTKWSADRYITYTSHFKKNDGPENSKTFCAFSTHKGPFSQEFHSTSRALTGSPEKASPDDEITGPFAVETIQDGPYEMAQLQTGN